MAHSALDIASYFIRYSGFTKTQLQIQKMSYIAHGYMLGVHDQQLIHDRVEAWKHGPVYRDIHDVFKKWKGSPIARTSQPIPSFTPDETNILENVFGSYGRFCGYYLSDITHSNGRKPTPWRLHYQPYMNNIIPDETTKEYYQDLYHRQGFYF